MTGWPAVAILLALALVVLPHRPRRRLIAASPIAVCPPTMSRQWWWCSAVVVAVAVAVALPLTLFVAALVVAVTAMLRRRQGRGRRRANEESRALEAALDILVSELRVGAHPIAAFRAASSGAGDTVGASFRAVASRAVLGADVAAGLAAVADSSALPAHWRRFAACWELAHAHGLTMATVMVAARRDIAERMRFQAGVDAAMAGARTTATVLTALPLVGLALGQLLGADPLRFLFVTDAGGWFLVAGVMLVCGGLMWSDRITQRALR